MMDATYTTALKKLNAFVPHAGYDYASQRNYDRPGHTTVSTLSPYIRHRIITEEEVLRATLRHHSAKAAEKFIQEVYWRTYWKGWLEMRPSVWMQYQIDLKAALNRVQTESGLRSDWEAACTGQTGIDCFDHWAKELVETGYLHNHARMWFASIWIFTLRLPWVLGADFFMRHLLDGDPASNTLSWRWVGGLQTRGKTYLAQADNIAKFTDGRFSPKGLARQATPLDGPPNPDPISLKGSDTIDRKAKTGLLLTEDDMSPAWMFGKVDPIATAVLQTTSGRTPLHVAPDVTAFVQAGLDNVAMRTDYQFDHPKQISDVLEWAQNNDLTQIITSYAPVGPTADVLRGIEGDMRPAGITLSQQMRPYDANAWPHATKGFFKFKERIPALIASIA